MTLELLHNKQITEQLDSILDFYLHQYDTEHDYYQKALENTDLICLAIENNKIIGSLRILTDFTKWGHIVDFIIDPDYRKQGIGLKLISFAAAECKKLNITNFGLTCRDELIEFYAKSNFRRIQGFEYMKYNEGEN